MSDKKKIDEAAILNVSTTGNGMTGETTFVADDAVALAQLLKSAGVESNQFNGPAMLSIDVQHGNGSMTSRVSAPDLRSIMRILEPEFQQAGDAEVEEPCADCDAIDTTMEPGSPVLDTGATSQFNVAVDQYSADNDDTVANMADNTLDDPMNLDSDIEEDADYDYRSNPVQSSEYPGKSDFKQAQPSTKEVPARAGDNPLEEAAPSYSDTEEGALLALKYLSSHDLEGATAKPDPWVEGVWLVSHKNGQSIVYLNQNDFEDVDEAVQPKNFSDYVKEAELTELSRSQVSRYVGKVNSQDYNDAEDEILLRRGRGLGHAQSKIHWKDANVLATESDVDSLMNEFNAPVKRRMPPSPRDFNSVALRAREESKGGFVQHVDRHDDGSHSISDWMSDNTVGSFSNGQHIGGQDIEEDQELDEAGRTDWQSKIHQFGEPYYLNTDCGFASLNDLGTHDYFDHSGVVVLEIDRNGKKGLNYVAGHDSTAPGTKVTCITQTSTGQKFRPGKVVASFTMDEYQNDRQGLEKRLAALGISPTKKLSVKTFD